MTIGEMFDCIKGMTLKELMRNTLFIVFIAVLVMAWFMVAMHYGDYHV